MECEKDQQVLKLMKKVIEDKSTMNRPISEVMEETYPILEAKENISEAKEILKKYSAFLVRDFGRITNILTRYDFIDFNPS